MVNGGESIAAGSNICEGTYATRSSAEEIRWEGSSKTDGKRVQVKVRR
jgi:hypothetical protein